MNQEDALIEQETVLEANGWRQNAAYRWVDPVTLTSLSPEAAFAVHQERHQPRMKDTQYFALLNIARSLAQKAHGGQYRHDKTTPYIEHPQAVAKRVQGDPDAEIVAWLHDTMEADAAFQLTEDNLRVAGIPERHVQAVALLTRRNGTGTYLDHIKEIAKNPLARKVKIADNLANLADQPEPSMIRRYARSLVILTEE